MFKDLCDVFAPSGDEQEMREYIIENAKRYLIRLKRIILATLFAANRVAVAEYVLNADSIVVV